MVLPPEGKLEMNDAATRKRRTGLIALLAALLCALVCALVPGMAWADGTITSEGGELTSGTYTLEEDVTLTTDLTIPSGAEVTIDLNGHTLTGTGTDAVITVNGGTLTVKDSSSAGTGTITGGNKVLEDEKSEIGGGGIAVYSNGTLYFTSGTVSGCKANYGGGIYVKDSTFYFSGGTVTNCTADVDNNADGGKGGGIYLYNATFSMTGGTVSYCVSNVDSSEYWSGGGGIFSRESSSEMSGGTIENCSAPNGSGGGLFVKYGKSDEVTDFTLSGGSIVNNSASSEGGGVKVEGSGYPIFVMTGGTITGNTAANGGGIDGPDDTTVTITGGVIANNTASESGDDIYAKDGCNLTVSGVNSTSSLVYLADGCGLTIDGWYNDTSEARYYKEGSYNYDLVAELSGTISNTANDSGTNIYLTAAHGPVYTVTYYDGYSDGDEGEILNDGLGAILSQTDDNIYGAAVPTTDNPTRTGYRFLGWELEGSDGSVLYSSSDIAEMTVAGDMAFVAQWSKTYTVSYDANSDDATGSTTDANEYIDGETVTVASNGFSLTGYKFTGWNTAADGTGTSYAADGTFTMTADLAGDDSVVVLYAQWEPISYTIAFDANAEDASGTMDKQSMAYDVAANLDANQFARTGYTFAGWNTASDGSGASYADGQEVVNLTTEDGGEVTLYAQWEPISYAVAFDANAEDASGTMDDQSMAYDVAANLDANQFARTGYTFAGWNTASDGSGTSYADGQEVVNLTTTDGDEVVLYAQWTEDTYTVTYTDGVDGEDVFEDTVYTITYTQKTAGEIPGFDPDSDGEDNTPERDGYTFAGWDEIEDEDGNLTYTATWEEVIEETLEEDSTNEETPEAEEAEEESTIAETEEDSTTDETTEAETETEEETIVQTGDYTALIVLCIAAAGAIALIAGILASRRRKA